MIETQSQMGISRADHVSALPVLQYASYQGFFIVQVLVMARLYWIIHTMVALLILREGHVPSIARDSYRQTRGPLLVFLSFYVLLPKP